MEIRGNGLRYKNYNKWENIKNSPFDYANEGILNYIMSPAIVNTTNPILKFILNYLENSLIFVLKYIDILKNFKNPHWRNR